MGRISGHLRKKGHVVFVGLFFILILQGCSTSVEVKCGSGGTEGMGQGVEEGVGACTPTTYTPSSAYKFWITVSTQYWGTHACNSGVGCAIAGRCADGKSCRSWVNTSTWACKCDCKP
jgi:hypothetical protein